MKKGPVMHLKILTVRFMSSEICCWRAQRLLKVQFKVANVTQDSTWPPTVTHSSARSKIKFLFSEKFIALIYVFSSDATWMFSKYLVWWFPGQLWCVMCGFLTRDINTGKLCMSSLAHTTLSLITACFLNATISDTNLDKIPPVGKTHWTLTCHNKSQTQWWRGERWIERWVESDTFKLEWILPSVAQQVIAM